MKCPECGEKLRKGDKVCPACGYPIDTTREPNKKRWKIIGIILLMAAIVFGMVNYSDAKPTIEAIDSIGAVTIESEAAIQLAQSRYEHLNFVQKLFVSNKKKLSEAKETFDSLPIEITKENVREYFDFNAVFTDLNDKDLSVYLLGMFYHSASANMEVICVPKKDKYFENVSVTLKYDFGSVYSWISSDVRITIDSEGKGSRTEKITYTGMISPSLPSSNCKYTVVSASGNVYNKKPTE